MMMMMMNSEVRRLRFGRNDPK